MSSGLQRIGGWAAILGGSLYLALSAIYFLSTHGSGESPRNGTLFGLDATDYCRLEPIWPALLVLGLVAFHGRQGRRVSRAGRWAFVAAAAALATVALSWVLQCWVVDPDLHFDSLPVTGGFYLGALANLAIMASLVVYGFATIRAMILPLPWVALPLAIGLLGAATGALEAFVLSGLSGPGPMRDVLFTANRAPWGLGWIALGYALSVAKV